MIGHGTKCSCCRVNTTKAKHTCEAQRVSTWAKLVSALVKDGYVPLFRWGCLIPTDTHPTCDVQPLRIHIIIQSVHMHPCGLYGFDWVYSSSSYIYIYILFIYSIHNYTDLTSSIYHQAPLSHFNSSTPLSDVQKTTRCIQLSRWPSE